MTLQQRREYDTYIHMIYRCYDPKCSQYKHYGGRGIRVCDRWNYYKLDEGEGLRNFLEDMGPKPEGMTLDRIDNDGDYSPENCRWATQEQQNNNTRRNVYLTYKGETMSMSQWSRKTGIPKSTISIRKKRGESDEEALDGWVDEETHKEQEIWLREWVASIKDESVKEMILSSLNNKEVSTFDNL